MAVDLAFPPRAVTGRVRWPQEDPANRVGAFSHFDRRFPTQRIEHATTRWDFKRSQLAITYTYRSVCRSLGLPRPQPCHGASHRLGRSFAHGGAWAAGRITTVHSFDRDLAPGRSAPTFCNGYLLPPFGQTPICSVRRIRPVNCVDPAVPLSWCRPPTDEVWSLWTALDKQLGNG